MWCGDWLDWMRFLVSLMSCSGIFVKWIMSCPLPQRDWCVFALVLYGWWILSVWDHKSRITLIFMTVWSNYNPNYKQGSRYFLHAMVLSVLSTYTLSNISMGEAKWLRHPPYLVPNWSSVFYLIGFIWSLLSTWVIRYRLTSIFTRLPVWCITRYTRDSCLLFIRWRTFSSAGTLNNYFTRWGWDTLHQKPSIILRVAHEVQ